MKSLIVAYDAHRGIGKSGGRPWAGGKMRDDMKRFRDLTRGKTVIMGRRTFWEDIGGKALPGRQNIVLTRGEFHEPDTVVARSLEEAYTLATNDIVVIGGASVYAEVLKDIDVIYATEMQANVRADAFFPELLPTEWRETAREHFESDERNIFPYDFVTFERIS